MSLKIEIIHTPRESEAPDDILEVFCGLSFQAWSRVDISVNKYSVRTGEFEKTIDGRDLNYYLVDYSDVIAALRDRDPDTAKWWEAQPVKPRVFVFESVICREL